VLHENPRPIDYAGLPLEIAKLTTHSTSSFKGYNAGFRLGEVIDKDMIAVPISGDLRLTVVGSRSYFVR
jgi:hypothetical protein